MESPSSPRDMMVRTIFRLITLPDTAFQLQMILYLEPERFNLLWPGNICMDLLPLISCPTFIIHGEKDPMVPGFHPQYLLKHIRESR